MNPGRTRDTSQPPAPAPVGRKQRWTERGREFVFSWGKCARYLGFLAAGGCRRRWLLGARRLFGQPIPAVLAGAARRDHCGDAGTVLGSGRNSEARLPPARPLHRALGGSAQGPGDSHPRPGADAPSAGFAPALALPTSPALPRAGESAPRPRRACRHLAGDRTVVTATCQRASGLGLGLTRPGAAGGGRWLRGGAARPMPR